jgi:hypothetical protein
MEWEKNQIGPKEALEEMKKLRCFYDGDKKIINLTPHVIHVKGVNGEDIYIPKSGAELRISTIYNVPAELGFSSILTYNPDFCRLNIYFKRLGKKNLLGRMPLATKFNKEMPNTYILTSRIAARHLEDYERVLVVGVPGQKSNQPHLSLYSDSILPNL